MPLAERLVWALLIVIVDAAAFALPLAALVLAYVLLARPRWFRDWVEQLCRRPGCPLATQHQDAFLHAGHVGHVCDQWPGPGCDPS
jgi:hypothetical protein